MILVAMILVVTVILSVFVLVLVETKIEREIYSSYILMCVS